MDCKTQETLELDADHQHNNFLGEMPNPPGHLAPEILRLIFLYTLPPQVFLDMTITPGPFSPWMQTMTTKQAITETCKDWYEVGVEFLYEHIALRSALQLAALISALRSSPRNLGNLIKGVSVNCYFPDGISLLFKLDHLFELCPRLSRVSFNQSLPCQVSFSCLKAIIHLEIGPDHEMLGLIEELSSALKSLSFWLSESFPHKIYYQEFRFSQLESLTIVINVPKGSFLDSYKLPINWVMPKLRKLAFTENIHIFTISKVPEFQTFCKTHGRGLKLLAFNPYLAVPKINYPPPVLEIQAALDSCPGLEHLVLHPATMYPLNHAKVRWIDVWASDQERAGIGKTDVKDITKENFPALEGLRVLDGALATLPEIPCQVPHSPSNCEYRFPGVDIRSEGDRLYRADMLYVDDQSDDGSNYEYASSSGWESETSDLPAVENEENMDLETALDIFRDSIRLRISEYDEFGSGYSSPLAEENDDEFIGEQASRDTQVEENDNEDIEDQAAQDTSPRSADEAA